MRTWIERHGIETSLGRRIAAVGFMLFLVKGLMWLALPIVFYFAH